MSLKTTQANEDIGDAIIRGWEQQLLAGVPLSQVIEFAKMSVLIMETLPERTEGRNDALAKCKTHLQSLNDRLIVS
jgi:hypothetical protein